MTDIDEADKWLALAFTARDEGGLNAALGFALLTLREHQRHLRATAPAATVREETCPKCHGKGEVYAKMFGGMRRCMKCDGSGTVPSQQQADPQPAESEGSDEGMSREDFEAMAEQLIAEYGWPSRDRAVRFLTSAIANAWYDGNSNGGSSAARELAERDERIRVLEAEVESWKPIRLYLASVVIPASGPFDDLEELQKLWLRAYPYDANHLRPGEKA